MSKSLVMTVSLEGFRLKGLEREIPAMAAQVANELGARTALHAAAGTPIASEQEIRALPRRTWWPKFVAKKLKRARGGRARIDSDGQRRFFSKADAKRFSSALVERRLRRRGSLRAGWRSPVELMGNQSVPGDTGRPRKHKGYVERAKPGVEAVCVIGNDAPNAHLASRALDRAVDLTEKESDRILAKHLEGVLKKYA